MTPEQITAMQDRIRIRFDPTLVVDGFWGPKSIAACQAYVRSLMPDPNPWPRANRAELEAFYGAPGDESNLVPITFPYPMFYGGKRVLTTRCHKKVASSLLRVLKSIDGIIPQFPHIKDEAEDYGGIYNFRPKRGSTSLSMHAWGIAIDLDADDNSYKNSWPIQSDMPLEIIECFAREGWKSAAVFWGYDAMHFEATR